MDYPKLRDLYNKGDCVISPTMADAFNIPLLEGMACGLPVITTDFGGQTDFVNSKNGWIITDGEMGEFSSEILYEGVNWKKPNINSIKKVMRYVYEHPEEVKEKGKQALEDSKNWTWKNSAEKLKLLME